MPFHLCEGVDGTSSVPKISFDVKVRKLAFVFRIFNLKMPSFRLSSFEWDGNDVDARKGRPPYGVVVPLFPVMVFADVSLPVFADSFHCE